MIVGCGVGKLRRTREYADGEHSRTKLVRTLWRLRRRWAGGYGRHRSRDDAILAGVLWLCGRSPVNTCGRVQAPETHSLRRSFQTLCLSGWWRWWWMMKSGGGERGPASSKSSLRSTADLSILTHSNLEQRLRAVHLIMIAYVDVDIATSTNISRRWPWRHALGSFSTFLLEPRQHLPCDTDSDVLH